MTTKFIEEFNPDVARSEVAIKFDDGKSPYELLAPELLEGLSIVLGKGARKYSKRNWEKGMQWGRVFGACMRHMWAWWRGENIDNETGLSHLWHASCCIMFLVAYEQRGVGEDDRPIISSTKATAGNFI